MLAACDDNNTTELQLQASVTAATDLHTQILTPVLAAHASFMHCMSPTQLAAI